MPLPNLLATTSGTATTTLVVLADVALILVVAAVAGRLAGRLGQPAVVGEILAGIALGPSLLGLLAADLPGTVFPTDARPAYELATIRRWMQVFLKRYFANQFKRSAMPNGPKISSGGALSPRGDWRMPSDATADIWLAELHANTAV